MKKKVCVIAALLLSPCAMAASSLSCDLRDEVMGAPTKVHSFAWSSPGGLGNIMDRVNTSIGEIRFRDGPRYQTVVSLSGRDVDVPRALLGQIRFGEVREFGSRTVLVYKVERDGDSSASPSEVVVAIDKNGSVIGSDSLPGNGAPTAKYCPLIEGG